MSAIHEHVLPNGMTLLCWHQPYLRGLEMGLYLKGGSIYETEETQGISHLLEHLCFRGLGGLNHEMLQRTLNRFGADLALVPYDGDHFSVTISAAVNVQFFGWLSGFGDRVRILSPDDVAQEMREHVASILALYQA